MIDPTRSFLSVLRAGRDQGGFEADDVLALVLPLFRRVAEAHATGDVAPLHKTESLCVDDDGALSFGIQAFEKPARNLAAVEALLTSRNRTFEIVGESHRVTDLDENRHEHRRLDVLATDQPVVRPAYLPNYATWEEALGHHDPLTDILSLGLILASLACALDFTSLDELTTFAENRQNLFRLNARLHPVLARVIVQMTELNRHQRAPDLAQIVSTLATYRDQPVELDVNAIKASTIDERRRLIHESLRDRLFEISRRNRLIYFKSSLQTLNLSVASVPLVMDVKNIRVDQLFVWHDELAHALSHGQAVSLGKYLRIEDAPYIPGVLDKIISETRRDRAEYGFAQSRLVLCFLRWHNLKEVSEERIHSPLLLLPVEMTKRKGVRDAYVLTPSSTEAEVNPALRHHLKTLYGIQLPESVELQETDLRAFHANLQDQIRRSEPGVTLELIDRPRIELIHAKARQRLDQWKRRQQQRSTAEKASDAVSYSYDAHDYRPKGLQLFLERVRPAPCPISEYVGAAPRPRAPQLLDSDARGPIASPRPWKNLSEDSAGGDASTNGPPTIEHAQEKFSLHGGEEQSGNPYRWGFDLCSLTLGNFHYRKMTLVRDYSHLAETEATNPAFEAIFSLEPRKNENDAAAATPLQEQFPVIACDAAQAAAVARAREGTSFIIQGPPGTGKSQTITNLIADYIARGKRVLFVCAKRAAIDVVFHRLRQRGLDELCCLIHDSQSDKKAYIQNLKQTYEQWLAEPLDENAGHVRRQTINALENDLSVLHKFSDAITRVTAEAGVSNRQLMHRLAEAADPCLNLAPAVEEQLPHYALWSAHASIGERLAQTLTMLGHATTFSKHPLRWLNQSVVLAPRPLEMLERLLDEIDPQLEALVNGLELSGVDPALIATFADLGSVLGYASAAQALARRTQLFLLDPQSPGSVQLEKAAAELSALQKKFTAAQEETKGWRDRLSETDTSIALENAKKWEHSVWRFLQPGFWKLRKSIRARYDFSSHAVEPSLSRVLSNLFDEYRAQTALHQATETFQRDYGLAQTDFSAKLAKLRGTETPLSSAAAKFRRWILNTKGADQLVNSLAELSEVFSGLTRSLETLLRYYQELSLDTLATVLDNLRANAKTLPDLIPALSEIAAAPAILRDALCDADLPLEKFPAATASKTLRHVYRGDPAFNRFDGGLFDFYRSRLENNHAAFLKSNSAAIRSEVRKRFREHVRISNQLAAQLSEEQKTLKKTYASGRRDLEHEFGKTMRYRSIRDLAAGATGEVIRDLKPVWLMSPLSVSDTLPLDSEAFDVVIFDEASQIPVEEAVPAAYRAKQVIVVGDEMQLPPTTFFASGREEGDALEVEIDGEQIEVDLDAESFLAQAGRNLSSTLLAWHYRSRSEALISFSNAAFYSGNLFTIPDRQITHGDHGELRIKNASDAVGFTDALLKRSISLHLLENGLYEQRRNIPEAAYIAEIVRELLRRETKLSIGIVAFSEAQQGEIERALTHLANEDEVFGARLEAEYNREENDQFCGLFVKNLENVQGDERDIILLSICYGYDRDKRMLMNFGPINQRGGEKRLNVIFSRARHHMAVITSIQHEAITNDYNDGAKALKDFLRYAENQSRGDTTTARSVLENLNPINRGSLGAKVARDQVVEKLAAALRARGHEVDLHVGQSRFRCDLAIKASSQTEYALGILVDTDPFYANANLLDRYLIRPSILKAFGWKVAMVLTKDWLHQPEIVLDRLERALANEETDPIDSATMVEEEAAQAAAANLPVAPEVSSPRAPAEIAVHGPAAEKARPANTRYLEFRDQTSAKFWEVTVDDDMLTIRFGRIGTAGQTQKKTFSSATEAKKNAEILAQSKLKKGYVEVSDQGN